MTSIVEQLQNKIEQLRQRLHEVSLDWQASQAREAKLREVLDTLKVAHRMGSVPPSAGSIHSMCYDALALPHDDTALKEYKRKVLLGAAGEILRGYVKGDGMSVLKAMKDALERIKRFPSEGGGTEEDFRIMDSLIRAIEEVEKAEPVAYTTQGELDYVLNDREVGNFWAQPSEDAIPLHTHPAPTIPKGWKLVPIEPTLEMIGAAEDQADCLGDFYRAMLAAAPEYKP